MTWCRFWPSTLHSSGKLRSAGEMLRRWLRAPVVHFVLIGGLLFGLSEARRLSDEMPRDGKPTSAKPPSADARAAIVFSAARVRQLQADFMDQFGRSPSWQELDAFIQQAVDNELLEREARQLALGLGDPSIRMRLVQKMRAVSADPVKTEEALYREAIQLGLDDDLVIRRLLREKMRMLLRRDPVDTPIGEKDVREYVERHRDRFVRAEAVTFSHVFVSPRIHGKGIRQEAEATLSRLRSQALPPQASDDLSDPFPLGLELRGWSQATLARHFGDEFADKILAFEPGKWGGPIASTFGLHLVWVHARVPGAMPSLQAVWPQVVRELLEARAAENLSRGLGWLRSLYEVQIELPSEMSALQPTLARRR
jgi:hypothetical protein